LGTLTTGCFLSSHVKVQLFGRSFSARSSAVADRPRHAPCHWKSCCYSRQFEITPL